MAEFLNKFSLLLSPLLRSVLSQSCRQGSLHPSFTEACIMSNFIILNYFFLIKLYIIAKKGKDPMECASYRPISLLNTDANFSQGPSP